MEGKMLIKTNSERGIEIECDLKNVKLSDRFHILYCVEQVLELTSYERTMYEMTRHLFDTDEHIKIDLSKLGGSL